MGGIIREIREDDEHNGREKQKKKRFRVAAASERRFYSRGGIGAPIGFIGS